MKLVEPLRTAWIAVDLDAVAHNTRVMASHAGDATLCAVVKADGYGHGAVEVAATMVAHGAGCLAVAMLSEGVALRAAGITVPILILSESPAADMAAVFAAQLTPTLYTEAAIAAAADAAAHMATPQPVHLKVDTGMHRVGAAPGRVVTLAQKIFDAPSLTFAGCFTHFAMADEPDDPFTGVQLQRFTEVLGDLDAAGLHPTVVHAANSAAVLTRDDAMFDLVRCGIALYGLAPAPGIGDSVDLRPAMSVRAKVSHVKRLAAGEALSYGQRYRLPADSVVAVVPVGYADGIARRLSEVGGQVLVGGERRPIAGTVTMDQTMIDCGPDATVAVGDEVVFIGSQGDAVISVQDWADWLGTITYEIVCGFGPRLRRVYDGES